MSISPTDEQALAVELFGTGRNLAIEAGAGTGKTTTLTLLAEATRQRGAYAAFNRSIVEESARQLPANVQARTVHSHAFRAVGHRFKHRLNSHRLPTTRQAALLGVDPITVQLGGARKVLQPGFLTGRVMAGLRNFCQSADTEPKPDHIPYIEGIDEILPGGLRTWPNNRMVSETLMRPLARAWKDAQDPDGKLRYDHAWYLKIWQLAAPHIPADFVLFDEAQDCSPVMRSIVQQQGGHAQLVYVGDSQQAIYEWLGAVNALAQIPDAERAWLTQSFRFGPEVAEVANRFLVKLGTELRISGWPEVASEVTVLDEPDCVLTRTNATAVERLFAALDEGRKPHLIGGGDDVLRFARAALELKETGHTWHPDLACFTSWGEVQDYVALDEQGAELALLVKLVDTYGADAITSALESQAPEHAADLVLSTAHKAKGREWPSVQIADDFTQPDDGEELEPPELRLCYVAVTRAQHQLDATALEDLVPVTTPEGGNDAL